MIAPPFLQAGDTVGVIAPAYHIEAHQWEPVVPLLQSWGLQVEPGYSLKLKENVFAGSDAERLDDLVTMMCNPQIKAVICARGGYGSGRLLSELTKYASAFDPKWLIGYSDITALESFWINNLHWQCIHGPMPVDLGGKPSEEQVQSWEHLHNILFGLRMPLYRLQPHPLNKPGNTAAPVIGGNLSVIYSLNATPYKWQTDGSILFIEDVNESLYHLDRMMNNLRLSSQLENLSALLVGAMNGMKDSNPSFGKTAYEIIAEHVEEYSYPVVFDFPAGHNGVNYPIVIGASMEIQVTDNEVLIDQTSAVNQEEYLINTAFDNN